MPFPEIDAEGYLVDPTNWSVEWARATAVAMQIEMMPSTLHPKRASTTLLCFAR